MKDLSKANKRSKTQREADLALIMHLRLQGRTQREITDAINAQRPYTLCRQQVAADIAKLETAWREDANRDFETVKAERLAALMQILRELWEAWERSIKGFRRATVQEQTDEQTRKATKRRTLTTEDGIGDVSIMRAILDTNHSIAKLLGLYAPERREQIPIVVAQVAPKSGALSEVELPQADLVAMLRMLLAAEEAAAGYETPPSSSSQEHFNADLSATST